jgi:hypothetical protein
MVRYFRTWRAWRLVWEHQNRVQNKLVNASTEDEIRMAQRQVIQWKKTGDKIWNQRTILLETLEAAKLNMTPN